MSQPSKPTSTDIMKSITGLRADVKKLLHSHDDHERRISDATRRIAKLEPAGEQIHDLLQCNAAIVRELTTMRDVQKGMVDEVSRKVETAIRADLLSLRKDLRIDLKGVADGQSELTRRLDARPCVARRAPEVCPVKEETGQTQETDILNRDGGDPKE